jgi:hypothetical protein
MGLGKELLKELAKVGNAYDMEKIMLTVLKGLLNFMFCKTPRNNSSSKRKGDGVLQSDWVRYIYISYRYIMIDSLL